jgi:D-alanine--poly(phosphoribitol) ligase subunit 1
MLLAGQDVPQPECPFVHEVFESYARQSPDRTALTFGGQCLSYSDLNARANQFAHYLLQQGVGAGSVVGVCLDRSPEMVISVLGTLKVGAAYAPLDTTYPADRLARMIAQIPRMTLIVASPETAEMARMARGGNAAVFDAVRGASQLSTLPRTNPRVKLSDSDICYVIFTSGSTGTPKAVAVRHDGWFNLLSWLVNSFGFTTESSGLLISPFGFDITQRGLLAPLFSGSVLHLLQSRNFDAMLACKAIDRLKVRTLHCAPSALYLLVERARATGWGVLSSLEFLFVGGEPIIASRLAEWATNPGSVAKVVNVYGVAECTDVACAHVLTDYDRYIATGVPMGRPIDNVRLHLLDEDRQPVGSSEVGELWISGLAVGAGYLNDPRMTSERFVRMDHLSPTEGDEARTMYRTGDMARVAPDGDLMYVGRADSQIKVRGMRVDLGDVEAALHGNEHISQAVVLPTDDGAEITGLAAFVVPSAGTRNGSSDTFDALAIRRELLNLLPNHMVPALLIPVPEIPLTPNGKVDRSNLSRRLCLLVQGRTPV